MSPVSLLWITVLLANTEAVSQQDKGKCSSVRGGDCVSDAISYNCSYSSCRSIPGDISSDIREVRLGGNQIQTIDDTLGTYKQLEILDLSENEINSIHSDAFPDSLVSLNLSSNDITLDVISQQRPFANLTKLEYMYLANNKLENLTIQNIFSPWLPAIKHLDLSANKIASLAHNVFTGMMYLEILDLSGNHISETDSKDFLSLDRLTLLNMARNRLTSIPELMFRGLSALKTVDLSDNLIESVSEKSFEKAEALEVLHLERNRIRIIPTALCFQTKRLKSLYLDGNPLESIEYGSISPTLRILSIRSCDSLTFIPEVIQASSDLDEVTISGNRVLQSISEYALGVGTRVKHIDLSDNALTTLSEHLLSWNNVTTANLSGNLWNCDCHLSWIKSLPASSPVLESIVCYNPPHLRGRTAKSVDERQFSCSIASRYRSRGAIVVVLLLLLILAAIVVVCSAAFVICRCRHRLCPSLYREIKYETMYNSAEAKADDNDDCQPVTIRQKYNTVHEELTEV